MDLKSRGFPTSPHITDHRGTPFLHQTLIVIPALNEEDCVAQTVEMWLALGVGRVRVVDNGSSDDTAGCASKAGAEALFEPRRGYGAAAWRGLQEWPPGFEWVLFSSADGSDRLSEKDARIWQHAIDSGAEVVLGDRTSVRAARAHLKLAQRVGNWLCCTVIAEGWGRRFHDMASLRLVRRTALDRMRLCDRGFGWNLEMQVRALELGLHIIELPVLYFPRCAGVSKISGSLSGTFRAGWGIFNMLVYLWRLRSSRNTRLSHVVARLN